MTDEFASRLSAFAREGAIRAISTMMVMTQSYHPNMLILLYQFSRDLAVEDKSDYDDWDALTPLARKGHARGTVFPDGFAECGCCLRRQGFQITETTVAPSLW